MHMLLQNVPKVLVIIVLHSKFKQFGSI